MAGSFTMDTGTGDRLSRYLYFFMNDVRTVIFFGVKITNNSGRKFGADSCMIDRTEVSGNCKIHRKSSLDWEK